MKTVYFVGNAHLDPVWMWRWQEGSCEAKATVRSALDRMKEYPDFKFVCSSASVYAWIEDFDPAMFEEIKERVREGRWIIVGGWFVQPDCNLPSGEGFARQTLYSQRYFFDRFGTTAKIGYNVDSFGHNLMIPQILKKSGMDHYVFMRPGEHEKAMPDSLFRWRSPDGSEVLAYRIHERYCQNVTSAEELEKKVSELEEVFSNHESCMFFYGVGNHGGGPTKQNIDLITQSREASASRRVIFSNVSDYFDEAEKERASLPLHCDDLQHHAAGCYAAVSAIKTAIRTAENALLSAEIYDMMAAGILKKPYHTHTLKEAWQNVLFCHFHDIAGGCAIEDAYTDAIYMCDESISVSERLKNSALQSLSWAIDTSDVKKGLPIVLFNANPFAVTQAVQINRAVNCVTDANGTPVPVQAVQSQTHVCYARSDTLFQATVPPMGYATYYIPPQSPKAELKDPPDIREDGMENGALRITFDTQSGFLTSLYDKQRGREMLSAAGAVPVVIDESEHDTWSHAKDVFGKKVGVFTNESITVLEKGPVRVTLKVVSRYGDSTLTQYFSLCSGSAQLDVRAEVDWREKHKMLKLAFPTAVKQPKAYYEIPFGVIERPTNAEEEPGYRWVALADEESGLALLNTNKYSFSAEGNTLFLTAVRSPLYGDHGHARNEECRFTDQGMHTFRYAVTATRKGDWSTLITQARAMNTPLSVVLENNHCGSLGDRFCGISASAANVQISALKRSEDGSGTVLRLYETEGKTTDVQVVGALLPAPLALTLPPYACNTYFLADGETAWKEVLLSELEA